MATVISVIIPALNAAGTIGEQLEALAAQSVPEPWEVIVVDNGSTDATVTVCRSYDGRIPGLRVVRCARPGTGAARNTGAAAAEGQVLLFCDADDVVAPGWVATMAEALAHYHAAGGAIENERLNPGRAGHLPRHPDRLPVVAGFLPRALTANLGVQRAVFEAVGGFAEDYDYGSDDTEFSWRLQLAGYTLRYLPEAVVHYRHRDALRPLMTKAFRTARSRGRLFRDYRGHGMPRPRLAGVLLRWVRLLAVMPMVPFSVPLRWWWAEQAAGAAGRLAGSVHFRVAYL